MSVLFLVFAFELFKFRISCQKNVSIILGQGKQKTTNFNAIEDKNVALCHRMNSNLDIPNRAQSVGAGIVRDIVSLTYSSCGLIIDGIKVISVQK